MTQNTMQILLAASAIALLTGPAIADGNHNHAIHHEGAVLSDADSAKTG